jgi:hypothetical protein
MTLAPACGPRPSGCWPNVGLAIPAIGVGFASAHVGDFLAVLACAIALAAVTVASMVGIRRAASIRTATTSSVSAIN